MIRDNLQATDQTAITLCRDRRIPIHVFALEQLKEVFCEESVTGTIITER